MEFKTIQKYFPDEAQENKEEIVKKIDAYQREEINGSKLFKFFVDQGVKPGSIFELVSLIDRDTSKKQKDGDTEVLEKKGEVNPQNEEEQPEQVTEKVEESDPPPQPERVQPEPQEETEAIDPSLRELEFKLKDVGNKQFQQIVSQAPQELKGDMLKAFAVVYSKHVAEYGKGLNDSQNERFNKLVREIRDLGATVNNAAPNEDTVVRQIEAVSKLFK